MKVFGCCILLVLGLIVTAALAAPSDKKPTKEEKKEASTEKIAKDKKKLCGECDTKKCPTAKKCLAGLVRDRCGCCDVCGLEQDQLCNKDGDQLLSSTWYGRCGVDLECRQRTDVDTERVGNQSVCFCVKKGSYCGTDGKTYSSYCKLTAATIETGGATTLESHGPCKSKPSILKKVHNQEVKQNSDISLRCETEAYPLPQFQWTFTRPNGIVTILPSDDTDVSISTRGGPGDYQVTSHLLITNIQLKHEGTYGCIASNEEGMDQMLARIVVSTPEEKVEM